MLKVAQWNHQMMYKISFIVVLLITNLSWKCFVKAIETCWWLIVCGKTYFVHLMVVLRKCKHYWECQQCSHSAMFYITASNLTLICDGDRQWCHIGKAYILWAILNCKRMYLCFESGCTNYVSLQFIFSGWESEVG